MTTYVIRENNFFYGDDYDHYEGSKIACYFTDRAEAEAAYKRLEIEAVSFIYGIKKPYGVHKKPLNLT